MIWTLSEGLQLTNSWPTTEKVEVLLICKYKFPWTCSASPYYQKEYKKHINSLEVKAAIKPLSPIPEDQILISVHQLPREDTSGSRS